MVRALSFRLGDEVATEDQRVFTDDCISIVIILEPMRCTHSVFNPRIVVGSYPEKFAAIVVPENEGLESLAVTMTRQQKVIPGVCVRMTVVDNLSQSEKDACLLKRIDQDLCLWVSQFHFSFA
jgi:hypothetical protein